MHTKLSTKEWCEVLFIGAMSLVVLCSAIYYAQDALRSISRVISVEVGKFNQ